MLTRHKTSLLPFSFGVASIIGQVALLREFMSLFSGHEIIIGLFLSFWMLFVGLGALAARNTKIKIVSGLLPSILGVTFILAFLILYASRVSLVIHGAEPEFNTLLLIIGVTLMPLCITVGYAFTKFSVDATSADKGWSISKIYAWEQFGSSIGGGVLYLLMVQWMDSVQILVVVVWLLFFVSSTVLIRSVTIKSIAILLLLVSGLATTLLPVQKQLRSLDFKSEQIVKMADTPYGSVIVTKSGSQTNIYENGVLRSWSGEVESTEEDVHAVMMRHPDPQKVLLLGGASSGTFNELKKYNNVQVDYVDINPAIVDILKESENEVWINYFVIDPLVFLREGEKMYDVCIVNTGLPNSLQSSRFYSKEFFGLVKSRLKNSGIIGVKGPMKQFHKEDDYIHFLSTITATGLSSFERYDVFPGNNIFLLFTNEDFLPLFDSSYFVIMSENRWFNMDYLMPHLIEEERLNYLNSIDVSVPLNSCLNPVLLQHTIRSKSGFWQISWGEYLTVFFMIFLIALFLFNRRAKAMAVIGFSLSGVQLILIFMMQVVAGNLYEMIGALFAMSLGGMALGSYWHRRFLCKLNLSPILLIAVSGILMLLLPFILNALINTEVKYVLQVSIVYSLVLLFSLLGGVLFSLISYKADGDTRMMAGSVYGADLFGSSAGVLLTSLFLIPVAGMINSSIILGVTCLVFALLFSRV